MILGLYITLRIASRKTTFLFKTWLQNMSANSAGFKSTKTPWLNKQTHTDSRKTGVVLALAMSS